MNLKHFSWICLAMGVLAVVYQMVLRPDQAMEAASFFSTTMILMAVGFSLVRRELAKLRPEETKVQASTPR